MNRAGREWLAGLVAFVEDARRDAWPAATRGGHAPPPAAIAAERMILAAHVMTWLENERPALLAARRDAGSTAADPDPVIVVTTSPVGVAVVADVLGSGEPLAASLRDAVVAVTEREYRDWTKSHPDPDHLLHVNHWSWVKTAVPAARQAEFAEFAVAEGEAIWLHRTGTAGCGAERRACHVWKWNGSSASLLRAFFPERVRRL